ncbi:MAG: hypothetical protein GY717_20115 [Rhodobacteraceae bacterium]|nr:hypothetical protein [Paracoccaceae bacterium]
MFATLREFARSLTNTHRVEWRYSMTDAELATQGFNRDGLVRSYVTGLGHR